MRFYRDRLQLPELGRFEDHAGYDGVFLSLPGSGAHFELTSGGEHAPPQPHPETLLVLYLGDWETVRAAADRLDSSPIEPANPYWAKQGSRSPTRTGPAWSSLPWLGRRRRAHEPARRRRSAAIPRAAPSPWRLIGPGMRASVQPTSGLRSDESRDLEQRLGHRLAQTPCDLDRTLAAGLDERRRPEQGERRAGAVGECRALAHEEQNVGAALMLLAVATAGWAVGARRALRLPVKQPRREGVVAVAVEGE